MVILSARRSRIRPNPNRGYRHVGISAGVACRCSGGRCGSSCRRFGEHVGGCVTGVAGVATPPSVAGSEAQRSRSHRRAAAWRTGPSITSSAGCPGARGRQAGLSYPDDAGVLHRTHHLHEWQGCGFNDPDHSYNGGRVQLNGGRLDGFRRGRNDDFALGYYKRRDLATSSQLARHFTICDHWFASMLGPTFPNRFYTHSASTDRITQHVHDQHAADDLGPPRRGGRAGQLLLQRSADPGAVGRQVRPDLPADRQLLRRCRVRAICRRTPMSILRSSVRTRAVRTTTTRTLTFVVGRTSSAGWSRR